MVKKTNGGPKSTTDSDIVAQLLADRLTGDMLEDAIAETMPLLQGAFCFVIMDEKTVYGVRDPYGVRPLVVGRLPSGGWVITSETCALDIVGASYVRDVEPGEIVAIDERGLRSRVYAKPEPKLCIFEYVYLARPDSIMYERSVHEVRRELGRTLAQEAPADADLVIGVPDTGPVAAAGFAEASGIPYGEGIIKNRYVGRTFIQPTQTIRQLGIKLKLNPLPSAIKDKRLVVVDDSIVRGNTTRQIVRMLREAGAREVHLRITSPPIRWPCFYGIDMATKAELVATDLAVEEIRSYIGADSLAYLSLAGARALDRQPVGALLPRVLRRHLSGPDLRGRAVEVPPRRARRSARVSNIPPVTPSASYRGAGVDIEAGDRAVELMRDHVASTHRSEVIGGLGGFAGAFSAVFKTLQDPVLLSAADGVGTKLLVAQTLDRHETVGVDLVAMVVDDLVCHGAEPLFMLDYIACGKLEPQRIERIVAGIAEGCRLAGCALLGGETAEHPGVMEPDAYDLAAFAVASRTGRRYGTRARARRRRRDRDRVERIALERLLARAPHHPRARSAARRTGSGFGRSDAR